MNTSVRGEKMITHLAETRGVANHGWLQSKHTFSFAEYFNPERMGFGALRVINDDLVAGGMGFGTHPHRDMEIVSIPLEGVLQHKDSEGNAYQIKKGEVQLMSAGTGIAHSEYNASASDPVKFLQIWVLPKKLGIKPRYEQKAFELISSGFKLVLSPDGREESLTINQDAFFSLGKMNTSEKFSYNLKQSGNGVYIFVLKGDLSINGTAQKERDGVGITGADEISLQSNSEVEVLIMEVPMLEQN